MSMRGASMLVTAVIPALLATALAGCGPRRAAVYQVSGDVLLDGKPLAAAVVTFVPKKEQPAVAVTDAKGRFTLRTWAEGDGAVAGEHVVCIGKPDESSPPPQKPGAADDPYASAYRAKMPPPAYASPVTSPLRADVRPDGVNHFRFELEQ